MVADPATTRERRRFLLYAGVILLIAAILAVGLGLHQGRVTREALRQALQRVADSGAPASVADLLAGRTPGDGATVQWLDDFERLSARWPDEPMIGAEDFRARLEVVRSEPGAVTELVDLTALLACLEGPGASATLALLEALDPERDELPALDTLDDCGRLALRVARGVPAPLLERALDSGELEPIDVASLLAPLAEGSVLMNFPDLRTPTYLRLVHMLNRAAVLSAVDGDPTEAVRRLELAFQAAGLIADVPWLLAYLMWEIGEHKCLTTLEAVLPWLPPETDLSRIEAHLESLDPHRRLLDAARGERVFAIDLFESASDSGEVPGGRAPWKLSAPPSVWSWGFASTELEYLEAMEQALTALELGGPEGVRALEELEDRVRSESDSSSVFFLVPQLADRLRSCEELEAARQDALQRVR